MTGRVWKGEGRTGKDWALQGNRKLYSKVFTKEVAWVKIRYSETCIKQTMEEVVF